MERPLYGSSISKYAILSLERSLGAEEPPLTEFTVEHIMPRSYSDQWSHIEKEKHSKMKDLWANLVPLSGSMNSQVNQSSFDKKRHFFEKESMYITTRKLGEKYSHWDDITIQERSIEIAEWAIKRWLK